MLLEFEDFTKASKEAERIINLQDNTDIKSEIIKSAEGVPTDKRREYFSYMNTLFLNILLNRQNEFEKDVEENVVNARRILVDLIKG